MDTPLLSPRTRIACYVVSLVGLATFVYGEVAGEAVRVRVWETLLVNFLFWSGIAQAGVVLSALLQITSARWGRPLKRVAEATAAFMPVSFLVPPGVVPGSVRDPAVGAGARGSQASLAEHTVFRRETGGGLPDLERPELALRLLVGAPGYRPASRIGNRDLGFLAQRLVRGWRGLNTERDMSQQRQSRLAPAILIVYACVFSLQAFDFVMSLDPHWFSTLLGGYFFIGICTSAWRFLRSWRSGHTPR